MNIQINIVFEEPGHRRKPHQNKERPVTAQSKLGICLSRGEGSSKGLQWLDPVYTRLEKKMVVFASYLRMQHDREYCIRTFLAESWPRQSNTCHTNWRTWVQSTSQWTPESVWNPASPKLKRILNVHLWPTQHPQIRTFTHIKSNNK